jgi:hypothetical protein
VPFENTGAWKEAMKKFIRQSGLPQGSVLRRQQFKVSEEFNHRVSRSVLQKTDNEEFSPRSFTEFHGEREDFRIKTPCNSVYSVVFILGASLIKRIWHEVSGKLISMLRRQQFKVSEEFNHGVSRSVLQKTDNEEFSPRSFTEFHGGRESFRIKTPCNANRRFAESSVVFILGASLIKRIWHEVSGKLISMLRRRQFKVSEEFNHGVSQSVLKKTDNEEFLPRSYTEFHGEREDCRIKTPCNANRRFTNRRFAESSVVFILSLFEN